MSALTPEALDTIEARAKQELPKLPEEIAAGNIFISGNWLASVTDYEPEGIAPIADLLRGATPEETLALVAEIRRLRIENEWQKARIRGAVADYEEQCRRADDAEETRDDLQAKIAAAIRQDQECDGMCSHVRAALVGEATDV